MKSITIPELHEKFKSLSSQELIIDVRTPGEYAAGHVPRAQNIPVDQVAGHVNELKKYEKVYVYCRSGGRVGVACQILESLGLKNLEGVDDGGFPDWADAGYQAE